MPDGLDKAAHEGLFGSFLAVADGERLDEPLGLVADSRD